MNVKHNDCTGCGRTFGTLSQSGVEITPNAIKRDMCDPCCQSDYDDSWIDRLPCGQD